MGKGHATIKSKPASAYKKEFYGILFLALGAFLTLCLFSYNAGDPSFTSTNTEGQIHNFGGIIGSYLADLLIVLLGWAAYLIPLSCLWASFVHFAMKEVKVGLMRAGGFAAATILAAIFIHLEFGELTLGGKVSAAGGIIGWTLGSTLKAYLGQVGAYLFVTFGFALAFVWATHISLRRVANILFQFLILLKDSVFSFSTVMWVRLSRWFKSFFGKSGTSLKMILASWKWIRGRFQRRQGVKIARQELSPVALVASPASQKPVAPAPHVSTPQTVKTLASQEGAAGPKIFERVDVKNAHSMKRDQMDLIAATTKEYSLPALSLLESGGEETKTKVDEESLKLNSKLLEKKLADYGVQGQVTEIHPGPIVTMYEFQPAPGVKVGKIVNLQDDLGLIMGGKSVRIVPHLAGKAAVGIEIPNNERETVWLKDVISYSKFQRAESKLSFALGKDIEGIPQIADLKKMPHLLIAGATGAGKSVGINTMITSILYKATPEEVRFLMVDLKRLELSVYDGIPHLLLPVITLPKKAALGLRWCVEEMERRYTVMAEKGVRDLKGYNKQIEEGPKLPYIIVIIDELADLMMTSSADVERYITRLAQMARAAGIHLILATQRPSVDVITGLIKANFPARISFKVTSKHDSRTIIDTVGAEHLLGMGDMLFMSPGTARLTRIHGAFISDDEVSRIAEFVKKQGTPRYDESIVAERAGDMTEGGGEELEDSLYDEAVAMVTESRQASISMIQRRMRIGYNRAARMIERMEREGVVSAADGAKPRQVLAQSLQE